MADSALRFVNPDGIRETIQVEDGRVWHRREQDLDDDLRWIRHLQDTAPSKHGDADWRHVGSIPLVIAEKWSRECGAAIGTREFMAYCKRKLMDGEFAAFRVRGI